MTEKTRCLITDLGDVESNDQLGKELARFIWEGMHGKEVPAEGLYVEVIQNELRAFYEKGIINTKFNKLNDAGTQPSKWLLLILAFSEQHPDYKIGMMEERDVPLWKVGKNTGPNITMRRKIIVQNGLYREPEE